MAHCGEESLRLFQLEEKALYSCIGSGTPETINRLLTSFRSAGQDIILQDFQLAKKKVVEDRLWNAHGMINSQFRKQLKQVRGGSGQRTAVEQRALERRFLEFIKASQNFYRCFVQSLDSHYGGSEALRAVANRLTLSTSPVQAYAPATGDLQRLLLLSCHETLIRLGDLSRWRETLLKTKDRNWAPAINYYDLAGRIYPASGASHNQLAVIALQDSNHLGVLYHLYSALVAEEPHPNAKNNLEVEVKKIEDLWSKGKLSRCEKSENCQETADDVVASVACLHAYCYRGEISLKHEELRHEYLSGLSINLEERRIDATLSKVVLLNIAAEYFAGQRSYDDPNSSDILQSFTSLQRLNIETFLTLLRLLCTDLERHIGNGALANGSPKSGQTRPGPAKVSAMACRVLPSLRQYSSWLLTNAAVLMANNRGDTLQVQVQELWRVYARTLTLLASGFSWDAHRIVNIVYMLDEDEITLGILPFRKASVDRRYFKEGGRSQKPRQHDRESSNECQNSSNEMLGRIHDILIDGINLQNRADVPIILNEANRTFEFVESNISAVSADQARVPLTASQVRGVTHIDDTYSSQPRSNTATGPRTMDMDPEPTVHDFVDSGLTGERDTLDKVVKQVTQSGELRQEDTSYGLIGSATVLEHFGEAGNGEERISRSYPSSAEQSLSAPRAAEAQTSVLPPNPVYQGTPIPSSRSSQHMPLLQQPSKYFELPSSNSSMPSPTFQNSYPGYFFADASRQHPDVYTRNVQRVLDERVFRSSHEFPGNSEQSRSKEIQNLQ